MPKNHFNGKVSDFLIKHFGLDGLLHFIQRVEHGRSKVLIGLVKKVSDESVSFLIDFLLVLEI